MLLGPLRHSIPPPPLHKNEHIKGSNLKWAYDVLTFMPNYGLKTKRWRWDLSPPLFSLPCFFYTLKVGEERGEKKKKKKDQSQLRGAEVIGSASQAPAVTVEWIALSASKGGWWGKGKTLDCLYSLTKWAWTGALIRLVWTETWQQTLTVHHWKGGGKGKINRGREKENARREKKTRTQSVKGIHDYYPNETDVIKDSEELHNYATAARWQGLWREIKTSCWGTFHLRHYLMNHHEGGPSENNWQQITGSMWNIGHIATVHATLLPYL